MLIIMIQCSFKHCLKWGLEVFLNIFVLMLYLIFFSRGLLSVKCYDLELKHNTSNGVSDLSTTPLSSTNEIPRQAN